MQFLSTDQYLNFSIFMNRMNDPTYIKGSTTFHSTNLPTPPKKTIFNYTDTDAGCRILVWFPENVDCNSVTVCGRVVTKNQ